MNPAARPESARGAANAAVDLKCAIQMPTGDGSRRLRQSRGATPIANGAVWMPWPWRPGEQDRTVLDGSIIRLRPEKPPNALTDGLGDIGGHEVSECAARPPAGIADDKVGRRSRSTRPNSRSASSGSVAQASAGASFMTERAGFSIPRAASATRMPWPATARRHAQAFAGADNGTSCI